MFQQMNYGEVTRNAEKQRPALILLQPKKISISRTVRIRPASFPTSANMFAGSLGASVDFNLMQI